MQSVYNVQVFMVKYLKHEYTSQNNDSDKSNLLTSGYIIPLNPNISVDNFRYALYNMKKCTEKILEYTMKLIKTTRTTRPTGVVLITMTKQQWSRRREGCAFCLKFSRGIGAFNESITFSLNICRHVNVWLNQQLDTLQTFFYKITLTIRLNYVIIFYQNLQLNWFWNVPVGEADKVSVSWLPSSKSWASSSSNWLARVSNNFIKCRIFLVLVLSPESSISW